MTIEEKIKKYNENGIGYNCHTSEFKNLQYYMKKKRDILIDDLKFHEEEKEFLRERMGTDPVFNNDILLQIEYHNKQINLIVIALSYNTFSEYIEKFMIGSGE